MPTKGSDKKKNEKAKQKEAEEEKQRKMKEKALADKTLENLKTTLDKDFSKILKIKWLKSVDENVKQLKELMGQLRKCMSDVTAAQNKLMRISEPEPDYPKEKSGNSSQDQGATAGEYESPEKLQQTVKKLEDHNVMLTKEIRKLCTKQETFKSDLMQKYEALENEYKEFRESHLDRARNETLKEENVTAKLAKYENMEMQIPNLQQELEKLKNGNEVLSKEKAKFEEEYQNLKRENKEMCDELQEIRQVKEQEKHLWNKTRADLITKIESFEGQVKKLTFEKNDALTRLSELAGRRLVENNPAIADLSTEIRPTKIGENFMQVYDNEWTDAFEELQERGNNDDHCINILLKISQENFELATQFAKEFREKLFSTISCFPAEPQMASMKQNNTPERLTKDEEQLINQLKRASAVRTMKSIQEFVKKSRDAKEKKYAEKCERYAEKCLEMCWYMATQSPPLALIFEVKRLDPFDDRYFKKFVTTGDKFDYVVWPCILLHKDGPILAKGVAQAIKADSAKRDFAESAVRKERNPPQNANVKENPPGKREAELHMKQQERKESNPPQNANVKENPPGKREAESHMKQQENLQGKDEKQSRQKAKSFHGGREKAQNKTDFRTTIDVRPQSTQKSTQF